MVNTIQLLISLGSERLLCNIVSIRCNTPMSSLSASKAFMLLNSYDYVPLMGEKRAKLCLKTITVYICVCVCVNGCT